MAQSTQFISFPGLSNITVGVAPFALKATATSGLPVSITSSTPTVCTVSGGTVTVVATGLCVIVLTQAGNVDYQAATPLVTNFLVGRGTQTISFASPGTVGLGIAPFALTATASSGLAVSFASTTTGVCSVSAMTVSITALGICTIVASQAGNTNYFAANQDTQSFQVETGQTISFASLPNVNFGVSRSAVTATASSGLAVTVSPPRLPRFAP